VFWRRKAGPSDAASGDKLVIETLAQHGADLSKARHLRAYLYLPSEEAADAARATLADEGFDVTVTQPKRRSWLALAHREMVVNAEAIADLRARLDAVAGTHGGDFDGWEASPQP
jgi:hypothetical protein